MRLDLFKVEWFSFELEGKGGLDGRVKKPNVLGRRTGGVWEQRLTKRDDG